jgi:hypothetical protein
VPWQYSQRTGRISRNGSEVGVGYSGRAAGRNNPLMENIRAIGLIPRGRYRIGPRYTYPTKGPVTMALSPIDHAAHGRTHFLIHGDSSRHPGEASEGCIVLDRVSRQAIAASVDAVLEVEIGCRFGAHYLFCMRVSPSA